MSDARRSERRTRPTRLTPARFSPPPTPARKNNAPAASAESARGILRASAGSQRRGAGVAKQKPR